MDAVLLKGITTIAIKGWTKTTRRIRNNRRT